jgi:hypothetical protein
MTEPRLASASLYSSQPLSLSGSDRRMKTVAIQDFEDRATELLTGHEALTVEQHGQAVGVYIPLPSMPAKNEQDSLATLRAAVAAALANHVTSEDELAELFDLRHPLP